MAKPMPPELLDFLYDLAVSRSRKRTFYEDPEAYIDAYNKKVPASKRISPGDGKILVADIQELKSVIKKRKKAVPFVSQLEQTYGQPLPDDFGDTQSDDSGGSNGNDETGRGNDNGDTGKG